MVIPFSVVSTTLDQSSLSSLMTLISSGVMLNLGGEWWSLSRWLQCDLSSSNYLWGSLVYASSTAATLPPWGCLEIMAKLGPLVRRETWAELRGLLDRLITHLSCLDHVAGVGGATMLLHATMLVDVEEVVVAEVVGTVGALSNVFEVVTAAEVLVWSLELVFVHRGYPSKDLWKWCKYPLLFCIKCLNLSFCLLFHFKVCMFLNCIDETSTFGQIFIWNKAS